MGEMQKTMVVVFELSEISPYWFYCIILIMSNLRSNSPKPTYEHAGRSKSTIIRKVNQIKQSLKKKHGYEPPRNHHVSTIPLTNNDIASVFNPTFQTDLPSSSARDLIKYFIPVIIPRNNQYGELASGEYMFEQYRLDGICYQSNIFSLYDAVRLNTNQKLQIKVYATSTEAQTLGFNEIGRYMHMYEIGTKMMEQQKITKLKDFFFFKNRLCLVLECVGSSLSRVNVPIETQQVKDVVEKLLISLKEFNMAGMVHLDLNPTCIQIKYNGLCLSNLMLSQVISKQSQFQQQSMPGMNFWAPECLLRLAVNEKCDIWSVGCITYWLTTSCPLLSPDLSAKQMIYVLKRSLSQDMKVKKSICESGSPFHSDTNSRIQTIEDNIGEIRHNMNEIKHNDPTMFTFILGCLKINPQNRFSVEDALTHPFLA